MTPAGAPLDPQHPDSLASFVRVFTGPVVVRAWEHLDTSIATGGIAFDTVMKSVLHDWTDEQAARF